MLETVWSCPKMVEVAAKEECSYLEHGYRRFASIPKSSKAHDFAWRFTFKFEDITHSGKKTLGQHEEFHKFLDSILKEIQRRSSVQILSSVDK